MAHGLFLRLRDHPLRHRLRPRQHLREGAQPGEAEMSGSAAAHSVLEPSPATKRVAGALVILYAIATLVPLAWIVLTSFKSPPDSISYPPKVVFAPTLEGYCNLFTTRSRQTPEYLASLPPPSGTC